MALAYRERLAMRLIQNWTAMHPDDTKRDSVHTGSGPYPGNGRNGAVRPGAPAHDTVDDSLTSLSWLQNLNIMRLASSSTGATTASFNGNASRTSTSGSTNSVATRPQAVSSTQAPHRLQVDPNAILDITGLIRSKPDRSSPTGGSKTPGSGAGRAQNRSPLIGDSSRDSFTTTGSGNHVVSLLNQEDDSQGALQEEVVSTAKPPHSYATLICMAMHDARENRVTLAEIYNWITDNYPYYRDAEPSWQNSIRHNLSLNKCFQKVPRRKDEPGKGGFWAINPEFQNLVDRDIFRKRRYTSASCSDIATLSSPTPAKRSAREKDVGHQHHVSDSILHFGADSLTDALDMSWARILDSNIDIGGVHIKAEDIINMRAAGDDDFDATANPASSITAFSPPPSDSDDEVDELIRICNGCDPIVSGLGDDLCRDACAIDLTVHGVGLHPPDWWNDSLNGSFLSGSLLSAAGPPLQTRNNMHTPTPGDFLLDLQVHPWAEHHRVDLDSSIGSFETGLLDDSVLGTDGVNNFGSF